MTSFRNYALLHLAVLAAGLALAFLGTPEGSVRLGAEVGTGSSAILGLLTLAFGVQGLTGSMQRAFFTLGIFFLARMVAVAGVLMAAKVCGGSMLAAAAGFMGLYLAGQVLELTFVSSQWRAMRVEENRA